MNQHDQMQQMREALRNIKAAYDSIDDDESTFDWAIHGELLYQAIKLMEQALAAEPAPLVRLTDDALVNIYLKCKAEWKATNKRQRQRIAVVFGNAIMDAMERVNK